jgi:hypothetical protein
MEFLSKILGLALVLFLSFSGCGYKEGIEQSDLQSYVWFTGDTKDAIATIDNNEPFRIEPAYSVDESTGSKTPKQGRTLYQVSPGKHKVIVKKNDEVVVNRVILISAGITKEIKIP